MRQVDVFTNDIKAGVLTEEKPGWGYTFTYDESYLASQLPAVSINLPKRIEPFYSQHLFPFFSNILPEGSNRRIICRMYHLDEKDIFGLLCAMTGADFIGAVNVRNAQS